MPIYSTLRNQALVVQSIIAALLLQQTSAINVQSGDTVARIAAEQGVSVAALEAANPGVAVNDLQPGQVLSVPAVTSAASTLRTSTTSSKASSSETSSSKVQSSSSSSSSSSKSTSSSSKSPSTTPPPPPPPPPSKTPTPIVTAIMTTVGMPSCAPSPIGKYHDMDSPQGDTFDFCSDNAKLTQAELLAAPYNGVLSGDNQGANSDDGNGGRASNEKGYNMGISAVPECVYPAGSTDTFTVGQPLGSKSPDAWTCHAVLLNCWNECYNNKGMGGQLQAGCFLYLFEADP